MANRISELSFSVFSIDFITEAADISVTVGLKRFESADGFHLPGSIAFGRRDADAEAVDFSELGECFADWRRHCNGGSGRVRGKMVCDRREVRGWWGLYLGFGWVVEGWSEYEIVTE